VRLVTTPAAEAPGRDLHARIRAASNLPSPTAVAARLIEIADDPDLSMTMVAEVLRTDPALSAKLLRLANSPLYARRRRIDTLQQAVTMLGLDAVMTAALSLTLLSDGETMGSTSPVFRTHWTRSVHAAVAAQALAQRCTGVPPADAFLAALVQDIGVLVVARLEPDTYVPLNRSSTHAEFLTCEIAALGADHAEIGAELLESWNLPNHVVEAVRNSHDFDRAAQDRLMSIVAISGLIADAIAGVTEAGHDAADFAARIGIEQDTFAKVLDDVAAALPELAPLLNATVPPADRLAELAAELIMGRLMSAHAATDRLREDLGRAEHILTAMEQQNRIDPLTHLLSRRGLDLALHEHFQQWLRFGWPMAVLFVDIDHFKAVNDTFGHQGGDEALQLVAERVVDALRDGDVVGRYGGDEIVVILPAVSASQAAVVADRMVDSFRSEPLRFRNGAEHRQTLSIGIASTEHLMPRAAVTDLLTAADDALYEAKRQGRDRWLVANTPIPSSQ
jgi:diguanylate cyclase (GGDEF)-like protein